MCMTSGSESQQIGDSGNIYFTYDADSSSTVAAYVHRLPPSV